MVTDITEKKALEIKLSEQRVKQHITITKAVVTAQEKERSEIGEELHDNVNQLLAAAQLYLTAGETEDYPASHVHKSLGCIKTAMDEIRKLSHALVGPGREELLGLCSSISELAKDMLANRNIRFIFNHATYDETEIEEGLQLVIYRIIQEQISNILKHAAATEVKIELIKSELGIIATVEDNGKGFDTTVMRKGIGLKNIKHRTEIHNGSVNIRSQPGAGCKLTVIFGEHHVSKSLILPIHIN
jgi:signal transduction histidine kinase